YKEKMMEESINTFNGNNVGESVETKRKSQRFDRIKKKLLSTPIYLCPERAYLVTDYFKHHDDVKDPMVIRKAKALRHILSHKSVHIYPDELIVGNMGSRRISALIQPELVGIFMSEELLWIDKRKTTPFQIPWADRLKLLFRVFPYWLTRNMVFRAFYPHIFRLIDYAADQLNATYYLIHEAGGIGHFLPNYEKMLKLGVKGYLKAMDGKEGDLHQAARIVCEGLADFAARMAQEAERLAAGEKNTIRAQELKEIARICHKVPREPAKTFHEALQSLWLTHMAVNLEGLNSAISFGRMDQYLYPYYRRDLEEGRITPERARELLLCFSAKATEHVFLLSERTSQYHGGFLVVQAAIVGGMDQNGKDAVNDLTWLFLDVMEESGLRDPNYQARVHSGSPEDYLERVVDVARKGGGVPAFFSDEASIAALTRHGYSLQEARNYATVGCVELALPGKSFFSTDAGLFNLPICLELALNSGKRLNGRRQTGVATPDPESFTSIDQMIEAFRVQVDNMVARMIGFQQIIEKGNRDYHPTPLSSLLVDGCIESGKDVTAGGAMYNSSGIQGIGVADVADSLAALDDVVFKRRKYTMADILKALRANFSSDPKIQAELLNAPKYGNDQATPDGYADLVVRIFHKALAMYRNTRGGPYVPGFYSVTSHVAFGKRVGALPSGRRAGEPFASSLGPGNGKDRLGPTAVLNSAAHVDSTLAPNGYALNLRFDPGTLAGDRGIDIMCALVRGFFDSGGMQMQLNVLDPEMLKDARVNPGKYPGLVVRVAGYCAYFDDLHDLAKQEIIARTRLEI
ncbi:MAG: pyruvate formate lyase family protein, partial [Thermodesulfobacteriota bacterium]|nr:pyruvate formate lyase family protein [Thermodesulfobacteriota bacterium]